MERSETNEGKSYEGSLEIFRNMYLFLHLTHPLKLQYKFIVLVSKAVMHR